MSADPPAFEFFNEIGIIEQLSRTMFERAMPSGMTLAQFTVLNHFVRLGHHERSPAQLASAFQVTRPTMSNTLARLERAGLVAIRADPADGRAKLVTLTGSGLAMRERCLAALAPLLPRLDETIPPATRDAMLPALRQLRMRLDAMRDGEQP